MPESAWVYAVDESNFSTAVMDRSHEAPVLLDFWAEWCQPCLMFAPLLEKLANEYAGRFYVAKVNIDEQPRLAQQFRVESIPTVVVVQEGKFFGPFPGALAESSLREMLGRIVPSDAVQMAKNAEKLLENNPAEAKILYEKALTLEPDNTNLLAALAEIAVTEGDDAQAAALVARVGLGTEGAPRAEKVRARLEFREAARTIGSIDECQRHVAASPDDLDAALNLGKALAATGDYANALETLVTIVERDRDFGNKLVKETMVKIFQVLGQQHSLSNTYRARLASALY